jgi:hypothetical protein
MSAAGLFHVTSYAGADLGERVRVVVGVCAVTKTDAAQLVAARLTRDGYTDPIVHDVERLAFNPHGWSAGATLIYRSIETAEGLPA